VRKIIVTPKKQGNSGRSHQRQEPHLKAGFIACQILTA